MFYHALTSGNGVPADLEPVLLWENPDVTASFDAQTISLDLTKYAGVVIDYNRKTTNTKLQTRFYMKRNDVTNDGAFYASSNQADNVLRKTSLSDTGVQFYSCNNAGTGEASNTNMIPTKIYGIKNYIVEPAVGDLLWHNDNPTTALNSKDIAGDYSKYSKIYVEGRMSATADYKISAVIEKSDTYGGGLAANPNNGTSLQFRIVSFTDSNIHISIGYLYTITGSTAQNGNMCVITDIYGIE